MPEFEKPRIGRTALEVAVLGLGCATLGGTRIPVTRQGAEAIVRAAWEAGVRYVDAAPLRVWPGGARGRRRIAG